MRHILTLMLIMTAAFSHAQKAFNSGEKLNFTASYNMSGLLTDIAQVTMETNTVNTSKSTLLHLKCTAKTFSQWDSFFKIRDLYESYVNPNTLTPYLYKRDINEGNYYKFIKYTFDHKSNTVKSLQKKTMKIGGLYSENQSHSVSPNTKDLVTTIYHIRNLDIHKASPGDSETFSIIFDRKESYVTVKYLSRESINTVMGKKECYKLAISVNDSPIFKGTDKNLLWLTADENKVPVYAKFKVAVGSGELRLKSATGLKH